MLDWVLQSEHSSSTLGIITNVCVLSVHANHDGGHPWLTTWQTFDSVKLNYIVQNGIGIASLLSASGRQTTEHAPSHLARPTMEGKTDLGASSPAKPALHMPLPLSTTSAWLWHNQPLIGIHQHKAKRIQNYTQQMKQNKQEATH